eukprot:m51a1_g4135 hypothetical protein (797) ;mRNA; r:199657-203052
MADIELVNIHEPAVLRSSRSHRVVARARCVAGHEAKSEGELSLCEGDLVDIVDCNGDADWWEGACSGKRGVFPRTCVVITDRKALLQSQDMQQDANEKLFVECVVQFVAEDHDELDMSTGDIVEVLDNNDPDWWLGRICSREGWFPSNRVSSVKEKWSEPKQDEPAVGQEPERAQGMWKRLQHMLERREMFVMLVIFLVVIGCITPCVSFLIDKFVEMCSNLKSQGNRDIPTEAAKCVFWVLFTMVFTAAGFAVTKYISPSASGSGIPEVKTILSGIDMPQCLSMRTLVAKTIGLSFVIGAGIFAGKQGPMVHIGAMIATQVLSLQLFSSLSNSSALPKHLMLVGTACGISSHFGTPIGGMMFTLEVAATYYPVAVYWFAATASIVASVLSRIFYNLNGGRNCLLAGYLSGILPMDSTPGLCWGTFGVGALLGVVCGVLSLLFIKLTMIFFALRRRHTKSFVYRNPIVYCMIVAIATGLFTFPGFLGKYVSLPLWPTLKSLYAKELSEDLGWLQWGKYSPVITTLVLFVGRFILTAASIPMPVPIGLYATNLVIGSVIGRFIGELFKLITSMQIEPSVMSCIGGAAYVGAVTHTFSSSVIVLELTDNLDYLVHTLFATSLAITLNRYFSGSIFESIIRARSLPFLFDLQHSRRDEVTAADLMDTNLISITRLPTVKETMEIISACPSDILPVVTNAEQKFLVGTINKQKLVDLVAQARQWSTTLRSAPEVYENATLPLAYQQSPAIIVDSTPLSQLHMLFITMNLDHAFVTRRGRLLGRVTRDAIRKVLDNQPHII